MRVKIGESRRVVVAQSGYLKQHGTPMRPADLAQHRCLTFGEGTAPQRGWSFVVNGAPVVERVAGPLACNDGAVLHDWTLAGMGLAWRSLWEVGDDLAAGRLVTVLDDHQRANHGLLPVPSAQAPAAARAAVRRLPPRGVRAGEDGAHPERPVPEPPQVPKRISRPRS